MRFVMGAHKQKRTCTPKWNASEKPVSLWPGMHTYHCLLDCVVNTLQRVKWLFERSIWVQQQMPAARNCMWPLLFAVGTFSFGAIHSILWPKRSNIWSIDVMLRCKLIWIATWTTICWLILMFPLIYSSIGAMTFWKQIPAENTATQNSHFVWFTMLTT